MTTETIQIIVTERGSREVKRNLEDIGTGAKNAEGAVTLLKRTLGAIVTFEAAKAVQRTIDGYINMQNTLKQVTSGTQQLGEVTEALFEISQRTRTSFDNNAESFRRFALVGRELGMTQQEVLTFTESLNQAIQISGANSIEAQAGLIQFSQGLASGVLRGDELRSVLEQIPTVADVIAKSLGVSRTELRKMGEQGTLTSDKVIQAFKEARFELEEKFNKSVPTIGQSFTVLGNSIGKYVGELDKAIGFSTGLSSVIIKLSENIDILAKVIGIAGAAWVAYFLIVNAGAIATVTSAIVGNIVAFVQLAATVRTLSGAMALLNATFLISPFVLIPALIVGVVAAIVLFKDEIMDLLRNFKIFGMSVVEIFAIAADSLIAPFIAAFEAIKGELDKLKIQFFKVIDSMNQQFGTNLDPLAFGQPNFERAGRSAGENFVKGYNDYFANGFLSKELNRQATEQIEKAASSLGEKIPGGSGRRATAVSAESQKAMEDAIKRQKSLLEDIKGAQLNYNQTVGDLNVLLDQGKINTDEFAEAMDKLNLEVLENDKTINGGFQRGLLKIKEEFSDLSGLAENTLVNAFKSAEDALTEFVTKGKLDFKGFVDSILVDLARMAVRQSIIQPLMGFFGITGKKDGGIVGYASGGFVSGAGGPRSDSIPAMLSNGEYVINADATRQFRPILDLINSGRSPTSSPSTYTPTQNVGGGSVFAPVVNVTVEMNGNGEASQGQAVGDGVANKVNQALENKMSEFLMRQIRPGGMLNEQGTY